MRLSLFLGMWFMLGANEPSAILLQDDFADGNYTAASGVSGMTWTVLSGGASVAGGQLTVHRTNSFIICDQRIATNSFTIQFDAENIWSEPSRFIFLYKDLSNYYWMGLGGTAGVYRVMGGVQEPLYTDSERKLCLPDGAPSGNLFRMSIHNTGSAIHLKFGRGGPGVEYGVELTDTNSAAAAWFTNTAVGAADDSSGEGSSFKLDNILITRPAVAYYVDAVAGDDTRTAEQAVNPATPWQTIQRAVSSADITDTVLIRPGVYRETVTPVRSGKASAPITIKAFDPAHKPVIDGSEIVNAGDWQETTLTDFKGVIRTVYKTPITWNPSACYQNEVQMFASQEPDQSSASDPYNMDEFRLVPPEYNDATSQTVLKDPAFFTQEDPDYWVGAVLLLYDGKSNFIWEKKIVQYIPGENSIVFDPPDVYVGPNNNRDDRYAVRNHPGCLDQPGEFYVDTNSSPAMLYVLPYEGVSPSLVSAGKRSHGVDITGDKSGLVIDGLDIRFHENHGVMILNGCKDITIRNCDVHHNRVHGINARFCDRVLVDSSLVYANRGTGVNFAQGANYAVTDCEVTANGDNGIWAGSGSVDQHYVTEGVTVRGCYVHRQGSRRRHPDNYQMTFCRDILLENNVFIQEGHQNMWCEYTDNFTLRNNIFMGGPLGINSSIHSYLYHNVFYNATLRYDERLMDSPFGGYYRPQKAEIRNNSIIESDIWWPSATLVDRQAVYTVDHNYYNLTSTVFRTSWAFSGLRLGINQGGSILTASPQFDGGNETTAEFDASVRWSAWGRFICLYKDQDNYYSFGFGDNAGIFRKLNGVETLVYPDTDSLIRMPHTRSETSRYKVSVRNTGSAIQIKIARDQTGAIWNAEFSDTDAGAVAKFNAFQIGAMTGDAVSANPQTFIDSVVLTSGGTIWSDDFEDGNYDCADGANGLVWIVKNGGASVSFKDGVGVGYGEGSILHTNPALLSSVFSQPPDSLYTNYNFRLTASSPLRDAGVNSGIATDLEGNPRVQGSAPDIGPYEYDLSAPPAASFTATPVSGSAPLTVSFTDSSTGGITGRFWDFGDGITTNTALTGIQHTYAEAGTYTVELVASGPSGSSTNRQTDYIRVEAKTTVGVFIHGAPADQVRRSDEGSLVSVKSASSKPARIGNDSGVDGIFAAWVIPFLLPDIGSDAISSASLHTYFEKTGGLPATSGVFLDLLGVRVSASSTVIATDYQGTVIGDNLYNLATGALPPLGPVEFSSAGLAAYLQSIYDNDANAAGKYVFLTLAPDATLPKYNYVDFTTAEGDIVENRPVLELQLGTSPSAGLSAAPSKEKSLTQNSCVAVSDQSAAADGILPVLIAADPDNGVFTLRGVAAGTVSIATASGTPIGTVQVSDGSVQVDVHALSMKSGLYRIVAGDRTMKVILL